MTIELSPTPALKSAGTAPMSPDAYESHLKGIYFQGKRTREDTLRVETTMDMAALYAWTNDSEGAYHWWKQAEEINPIYTGLHQAGVIGFCGTERHAEALEEGLRQRDFLMLFLSVDSPRAPLRDDPRFTELLDRIGLPSRVAQYGGGLGGAIAGGTANLQHNVLAERGLGLPRDWAAQRSH